MARDVEEFIDELNRDNEAFFAGLPETDTVYWADKLDGKAAAEALKPRWFNEIRGVEIIGRFIGRVPDLSLKALVGRQVGDEAKHARHCRKRIEALGGSVPDFDPSSQQVFARTAAAQERARRACEAIREAHVAMVRAHSDHMLSSGYLGC